VSEQQVAELQSMRQAAIDKGDLWSVALFNCFLNTLQLDETTIRGLEIVEIKKENQD